MTDTRSALLQLSAFAPGLETALAERGSVVRWFDMGDDARRDWLAAHRGTVRVILTGGHLGAPTKLVEALPNLGLIAINGVGYDRVDIGHAMARGIAVTNTPDVLTDDVADLAIGLILSLGRRLPAADAFVRAGRWREGAMPLARKVSGRRFGIVGLGRIGGAIAARLAPFGPVAYAGRSEKDVPYRFHPDARSLAIESDVLVVAAAATPETRHLIDADVLAALGGDGWLVNIARGSVVDQAALVKAIERGTIGGAALDVFEDEPCVPQALIDSDRTVLTPHIASATTETRAAMADLLLANLDAFLGGRALPTPVTG